MKMHALLMIGWLTACALFQSMTSAQAPISYQKNIEPIWTEKCVACHNHTTRQGGLNLETHAGLMNGGKRGAAIVPGQSGESLLVKMLEGVVKPQMPLGDQLSPDEIKTVKAWIDTGARGPDGSAPKTEIAPPVATTPANVPTIKPTAPVNAAISALAFQTAGTVIALGRYQTVELINAHNGAPLGQLAGHVSQVRAVAFSPDGQWLATAGGNPGQFGEIKLWDVAARRELRQWRGHRDNIFALTFSPDGKLLATCSYDRMIKLWDAATGAEIKNLKDHTDAVFAVAFSPDGKRLASASADRTVKIWDVASGQRIYTLSDALDAVNTIAFHPAGKLLAGAGADRIIRLWELDATEGRQVKSLIAHEDAINQVAFSPDGKLLVSTGADKLIKLWEAAKLEQTHLIEAQPDWVFALAFSPDGKRFAAGRYDGSLAFYDAATGKKLASK